MENTFILSHRPKQRVKNLKQFWSVIGFWKHIQTGATPPGFHTDGELIELALSTCAAYSCYELASCQV